MNRTWLDIISITAGALCVASLFRVYQLGSAVFPLALIAVACAVVALIACLVVRDEGGGDEK
jgi:hypothetical protein